MAGVSTTAWRNLPNHIKKGNIPQKDVNMAFYNAINMVCDSFNKGMKTFTDAINNTLLLDLQNRFDIIEKRLQALEEATRKEKEDGDIT